MTSHEKGRPLPKFGEWDVNNPASADGFTVIFAKARDEKKAKGSGASSELPNRVENVSQQDHPDYPRKVLILNEFYYTRVALRLKDLRIDLKSTVRKFLGDCLDRHEFEIHQSYFEWNLNPFFSSTSISNPQIQMQP